MSNDIKPTLDRHKDELKREIQYLKDDLRNRISDTIQAEMRRGMEQIKDEIRSLKSSIPQK